MRLGVDFNILNQKGTPAFYSDIFANRPAFGFAGRVFISTDTGAIYEDTGSAWTLIADAGAGTTGTLQQVTTNGKITDQGINITGSTLNFDASGVSANPITMIYNTSVNRLLTPVVRLYGSSNIGSNYVELFGTNATSNRTINFPDASGIAALGASISGYSISPNTQFPNAEFYSGLTSPLETHSYNIGVTGTALANSSVSTQWGVGVYGAGYTNGGTRSAGVQGDGEVTASADTGSAIGVRGYALATHAGGFNIGLYGDAANGSSNYALYMNQGGIFSANAQTWTLASSQQSALNIQSGLFNIDTINTAVGIGTTATTSGSAKLVVYSATSDNQIVSAGTAPSLRLYNTLSSPSVVGFMGMSAAANNFILGSAAGDMCIGTSTNGKIYIGSGSGTVSPTITLTNAGAVGIGSTAPTSQLQVSITSTSVGAAYIEQNAAGNALSVTSSGNDGTHYIANFRSTGVDRMRLLDNGNVLIGTTTDNGFKLAVNGSVASYGANATYLFADQTTGTTWQLYANSSTARFYNSGSGNVASIAQATGIYTPTSDINRKKDFEQSKIGLNAILNLKPTLFRMKEESNTEKHLGFIAQEVKDFIPQAYVEEKDFIGLSDRPIIAALVKAIQELNDKLVKNNIN